MFVWKLRPVISAEMGVPRLVEKAKKARLNGVWIKIAAGASPYSANLGPEFASVRDGLAQEGIAVWGWHEPRCKTTAAATEEARVVAELAVTLNLAGILVDAEAPQKGSFFQGGKAEATAYAKSLRRRLDASHKGLALCSHDIPHNFPQFPFEELVSHAQTNAPQVYYGGSPSVRRRLGKAMQANAPWPLPFVPVGAGWVGPGGGCETAGACAERALAFIALVKDEGFPGYSFWHWEGAPSSLWDLLFRTP